MSDSKLHEKKAIAEAALKAAKAEENAAIKDLGEGNFKAAEAATHRAEVDLKNAKKAEAEIEKAKKSRLPSTVRSNT